MNGGAIDRLVPSGYFLAGFVGLIGVRARVFVRERTGKIQLSRQRAAVTTAFRRGGVQQAREHILPRIRSFAEEVGARYSEVKIVDNRYGWGSCTPRNDLNFNWRLIKAPMHVIDYVIVRARSPNNRNAKSLSKSGLGRLLAA